MRISKICVLLLMLFMHLAVADEVRVMKPIKYQPLGGGVWMYTTYMDITGHRDYPTNGVVVLGSKDAMIIDLPVSDVYTRYVFDWIERQGRAVRYVVPQHFHIDSTGGLKHAQQRGAQVVMLDKTQALQFAELRVEPDVVFADEMQLQVGEHKVQLAHLGGGHSADSVVAWLPQQKILVGGCLIKSGTSKTLGNTADAVMPVYAKTIQNIQQRFPDIQTVTPGHGAPAADLLQHTLQLVEQHLHQQNQPVDMETAEIKMGYLRHAALTQMHRWYLIYEEPAYGIENQLDILDETIFIKSSLGEARGHDAYRERIKTIPSSWKNAHNILNSTFKADADGRLHLQVEIEYLNAGALPDGAIRSAQLAYNTQLTATESALPKFTEIVITPLASGTVDVFVPAYANNRMRSLVHYWFTLIEDPARDAEPVKEILAPQFLLNFSSGAITDLPAFKQWLSGPASQVVASTHAISDFSITQQADNQYQISMDLDWNGILPNQAEMMAKTRHHWLVADDPTERFARIQRMDVEILSPFEVKK